jgi:ubiquinol-cytochrome c reductase cytochrome b subunit
MKLLKIHPLFNLFNSYLNDSPQPLNISYLWNFGSLLGVCLIIQIITGITLAMHYTPSIDLAFISVEHIMRDVNYGWMIRYIHANVASFFFLFVYAHIGRNIYYGSYRTPRVLVFSIGVIIFLLMIITAFLGYVLPYGQMSLWGATVITNLMSAIPWIGFDIVEFLWGGYSVGNPTLNRFFSLHFTLPFVLLALVVVHLIALHENGSSNPNGISGNLDRAPFHPYFSYKDAVTFCLFFLVLAYFVFFAPNVLGHSDNYIPANPLSTPSSIVPEWYLLPFYAILRSIPNKLLGVIAMIAAILILLALPLVDTSRLRGLVFRPIGKLCYWIFIANFFILMYLGSQHVEDPYVILGQISTLLYFAYFLFFVPVSGIIENTLMDLALDNKKRSSSLTLSQRISYPQRPTIFIIPIIFKREFSGSAVSSFFNVRSLYSDGDYDDKTGDKIYLRSCKSLLIVERYNSLSYAKFVLKLKDWEIKTYIDKPLVYKHNRFGDVYIVSKGVNTFKDSIRDIFYRSYLSYLLNNKVSPWFLLYLFFITIFYLSLFLELYTPI